MENRAGDGGKVVSVDLETGEVSFHPELHAPCCGRQGLTIQVECEQCGAVGDPVSRLEIRAEKGSTALEWTG